MNNPDDLTSEAEVRKHFFPSLMMRRSVPLTIVRKVINWERNSSLSALRKLAIEASKDQPDMLVTLGDQLHGVSERGIAGDAGHKVACEYRTLTNSISESDSIHVPSEHPLGYWDGEDYVPHVSIESGMPRLRLAYKRDIGGALNIQAIRNWQSVMGPLWGVREVEDLRFLWFTGDFLRWKHRLDSRLRQLHEEQRAFVESTLRESEPKSVVLLTHRLQLGLQETQGFHDRLSAVAFADCHFESAAKKVMSAYKNVPFDLCFVPALWSEFGVDQPKYGIMEIQGGKISYRIHKL
ncbi:hypothetical protein KJ996_06715 [Patescibacteria group bacterium]|nr:hypothetical protein [Patescibacteria group bacterium]